jgi:hypothetical protein
MLEDFLYEQHSSLWGENGVTPAVGITVKTKAASVKVSSSNLNNGSEVSGIS